VATLAGLAFVPFLGRLAAERIGADRAASLLREQGFSFTQSTFREYYRAQQLRVQYGPLLDNIPERIPIPLSLFTPTAGRFIQPFRYVYSFNGTDPRTGATERRYVSLAMDSPLDRLDAAQQLARAHDVREGQNYLGEDISDIRLEQVQFPFGEAAEVL
jgi:hypothetical protein